jgi:hypothetical protein
MGEANDIAKLMGLKVEFSASKEGDELLIHYTTIYAEDAETGDTREKVVITMKEFYREYRKLKRMQ